MSYPLEVLVFCWNNYRGPVRSVGDARFRLVPRLNQLVVGSSCHCNRVYDFFTFHC